MKVARTPTDARGTITAFSAFVVVALLSVTAAVAGLVIRHVELARVQAAADLAALAAAGRALDGDECEAAAKVVAANGAVMVGCRLAGVSAVVEAASGCCTASAAAELRNLDHQAASGVNPMLEPGARRP